MADVVYLPKTPYVTHLCYRNGKEVDYTPIDLGTVDNGGLHDPKFVLPFRMAPTPVALSNHFLPDTIIQEIVSQTNAYSRQQTNAYSRHNLLQARVEVETLEDILKLL